MPFQVWYKCSKAYSLRMIFSAKKNLDSKIAHSKEKCTLQLWVLVESSPEPRPHKIFWFRHELWKHHINIFILKIISYQWFFNPWVILIFLKFDLSYFRGFSFAWHFFKKTVNFLFFCKIKLNKWLCGTFYGGLDFFLVSKLFCHHSQKYKLHNYFVSWCILEAKHLRG